MPTDATRERVALQGRFPATAEVKEVMAGKFVCFIFLRRLFTNLHLRPPHRRRPERGAAAGSAAVSAEGTAHDWPCTAASKQPQRRPPRTNLPPVEASLDRPGLLVYHAKLPFDFRAEGGRLGARLGITNGRTVERIHGEFFARTGAVR